MVKEKRRHVPAVQNIAVVERWMSEGHIITVVRAAVHLPSSKALRKAGRTGVDFTLEDRDWRTVKCQMLRSDPKFELFEDLEKAGEIVGPEGNTDSIGVGGIGASTDDREFEDVGIAG